MVEPVLPQAPTERQEFTTEGDEASGEAQDACQNVPQDNVVMSAGTGAAPERDILAVRDGRLVIQALQGLLEEPCRHFKIDFERLFHDADYRDDLSRSLMEEHLPRLFGTTTKDLLLRCFSPSVGEVQAVVMLCCLCSPVIHGHSWLFFTGHIDFGYSDGVLLKYVEALPLIIGPEIDPSDAADAFQLFQHKAAQRLLTCLTETAHNRQSLHQAAHASSGAKLGVLSWLTTQLQAREQQRNDEDEQRESERGGEAEESGSQYLDFCFCNYATVCNLLTIYKSEDAKCSAEDVVWAAGQVQGMPHVYTYELLQHFLLQPSSAELFDEARSLLQLMDTKDLRASAMLAMLRARDPAHLPLPDFLLLAEAGGDSDAACEGLVRLFHLCLPAFDRKAASAIAEGACTPGDDPHQKPIGVFMQAIAPHALSALASIEAAKFRSARAFTDTVFEHLIRDNADQDVGPFFERLAELTQESSQPALLHVEVLLQSPQFGPLHGPDRRAKFITLLEACNAIPSLPKEPLLAYTCPMLFADAEGRALLADLTALGSDDFHRVLAIVLSPDKLSVSESERTALQQLAVQLGSAPGDTLALWNELLARGAEIRSPKHAEVPWLMEHAEVSSLTEHAKAPRLTGTAQDLCILYASVAAFCTTIAALFPKYEPESKQGRGIFDFDFDLAFGLRGWQKHQTSLEKLTSFYEGDFKRKTQAARAKALLGLAVASAPPPLVASHATLMLSATQDAVTALCQLPWPPRTEKEERNGSTSPSDAEHFVASCVERTLQSGKALMSPDFLAAIGEWCEQALSETENKMLALCLLFCLLPASGKAITLDKFRQLWEGVRELLQVEQGFCTGMLLTAGNGFGIMVSHDVRALSENDLLGLESLLKALHSDSAGSFRSPLLTFLQKAFNTDHSLRLSHLPELMRALSKYFDGHVVLLGVILPQLEPLVTAYMELFPGMDRLPHVTKALEVCVDLFAAAGPEVHRIVLDNSQVLSHCISRSLPEGILNGTFIDEESLKLTTAELESSLRREIGGAVQMMSAVDVAFRGCMAKRGEFQSALMIGYDSILDTPARSPLIRSGVLWEKERLASIEASTRSVEYLQRYFRPAARMVSERGLDVGLAASHVLAVLQIPVPDPEKTLTERMGETVLLHMAEPAEGPAQVSGAEAPPATKQQDLLVGTASAVAAPADEDGAGGGSVAAEEKPAAEVVLDTDGAKACSATVAEGSHTETASAATEAAADMDGAQACSMEGQETHLVVSVSAADQAVDTEQGGEAHSADMQERPDVKTAVAIDADELHPSIRQNEGTEDLSGMSIPQATKDVPSSFQDVHTETLMDGLTMSTSVAPSQSVADPANFEQLAELILHRFPAKEGGSAKFYDDGTQTHEEVLAHLQKGFEYYCNEAKSFKSKAFSDDDISRLELVVSCAQPEMCHGYSEVISQNTLEQMEGWPLHILQSHAHFLQHVLTRTESRFHALACWLSVLKESRLLRAEGATALSSSLVLGVFLCTKVHPTSVASCRRWVSAYDAEVFELHDLAKTAAECAVHMSHLCRLRFGDPLPAILKLIRTLSEQFGKLIAQKTPEDSIRDLQCLFHYYPEVLFLDSFACLGAAPGGAYLNSLCRTLAKLAFPTHLVPALIQQGEALWRCLCEEWGCLFSATLEEALTHAYPRILEATRGRSDEGIVTGLLASLQAANATLLCLEDRLAPADSLRQWQLLCVLCASGVALPKDDNLPQVVKIIVGSLLFEFSPILEDVGGVQQIVQAVADLASAAARFEAKVAQGPSSDELQTDTSKVGTTSLLYFCIVRCGRVNPAVLGASPDEYASSLRRLAQIVDQMQSQKQLNHVFSALLQSDVATAERLAMFCISGDTSNDMPEASSSLTRMQAAADSNGSLSALGEATVVVTQPQDSASPTELALAAAWTVIGHRLQYVPITGVSLEEIQKAAVACLCRTLDALSKMETATSATEETSKESHRSVARDCLKIVASQSPHLEPREVGNVLCAADTFFTTGGGMAHPDLAAALWRILSASAVALNHFGKEFERVRRHAMTSSSCVAASTQCTDPVEILEAARTVLECVKQGSTPKQGISLENFSLRAFQISHESNHSYHVAELLWSLEQRLHSLLRRHQLAISENERFSEGEADLYTAVKNVFKDRLVQGTGITVRFFDALVPISFPSNTLLFRGLSAPKSGSSATWGRALIDLLVQGPGTRVDLAQCELKQQLSSQLGRVFFTADLSVALHPDVYFDIDRGALIAVDADAVHEREEQGRAFFEVEGSLNAVFLDVVASSAVRAIVLPERYRGADGCLDFSLPEFVKVSNKERDLVRISPLMAKVFFCPAGTAIRDFVENSLMKAADAPLVGLTPLAMEGAFPLTFATRAAAELSLDRLLQDGGSLESADDNEFRTLLQSRWITMPRLLRLLGYVADKKPARNGMVALQEAMQRAMRGSDTPPDRAVHTVWLIYKGLFGIEFLPSAEATRWLASFDVAAGAVASTFPIATDWTASLFGGGSDACVGACGGSPLPKRAILRCAAAVFLWKRVDDEKAYVPIYADSGEPSMRVAHSLADGCTLLVDTLKLEKEASACSEETGPGPEDFRHLIEGLRKLWDSVSSLDEGLSEPCWSRMLFVLFMGLASSPLYRAAKPDLSPKPSEEAYSWDSCLTYMVWKGERICIPKHVLLDAWLRRWSDPAQSPPFTFHDLDWVENMRAIWNCEKVANMIED